MFRLRDRFFKRIFKPSARIDRGNKACASLYYPWNPCRSWKKNPCFSYRKTLFPRPRRICALFIQILPSIPSIRKSLFQPFGHKRASEGRQGAYLLQSFALFSSLGKKPSWSTSISGSPFPAACSNLQGEKGMAEFLTGKATIQEIIHRSQEMSLDIIDAGSLSDHPSAILSTDHVRDFVSRIETAYDICVF